MGDAEVTVSVDRDDLEPGEYTGDLLVSTEKGNILIRSYMTVPEPEAVEPPAAVTGIDVRGYTGPAGTLMGNTGAYMEMARSLDGQELMGMEMAVEPMAMPHGYEGGFLLSWTAQEGIEGYSI